MANIGALSCGIWYWFVRISFAINVKWIGSHLSTALEWVQHINLWRNYQGREEIAMTRNAKDDVVASTGLLTYFDISRTFYVVNFEE